MGDETARDFEQYCDSPDFLEKEGIIEESSLESELLRANETCMKWHLLVEQLEAENRQLRKALEGSKLIFDNLPGVSIDTRFIDKALEGVKE